MSRWPADNQTALIRFYGEPGPEVERQLVPVTPPFKMYYEGQPVKTIRFHKKAAAALSAALNEIWEHYGRDQSKIDALGISKYAGAYNPRKIRNSATKWSNHAYGAAIDLNAEENGFGAGHGNIPQPVVDAFKRQGARWGGDYKGRTDPMHFEFCDGGTPAAQPQTFADIPQTDGDSDAQEAEPGALPDSNGAPQESWLKRRWRGVTGWLSGSVGAGAFSYFTTPWVIVAIVGMLFLIAVAFILFMGPAEVRAWIKKQVA